MGAVCSAPGPSADTELTVSPRNAARKEGQAAQSEHGTPTSALVQADVNVAVEQIAEIAQTAEGTTPTSAQAEDEANEAVEQIAESAEIAEGTIPTSAQAQDEANEAVEQIFQDAAQTSAQAQDEVNEVVEQIAQEDAPTPRLVQYEVEEPPSHQGSPTAAQIQAPVYASVDDLVYEPILYRGHWLSEYNSNDEPAVEEAAAKELEAAAKELEAEDSVKEEGKAEQEEAEATEASTGVEPEVEKVASPEANGVIQDVVDAFFGEDDGASPSVGSPIRDSTGTHDFGVDDD